MLETVNVFVFLARAAGLRSAEHHCSFSCGEADGFKTAIASLAHDRTSNASGFAMSPAHIRDDSAARRHAAATDQFSAHLM